MTFSVESRPVISWHINDFQLSDNPNLAAHWVFTFANGEVQRISGDRDDDANLFTFYTPAGFFTLERAGICKHQLFFLHSAGIPFDKTRLIEELVELEGATKEQAGLS